MQLREMTRKELHNYLRSTVKFYNEMPEIITGFNYDSFINAVHLEMKNVLNVQVSGQWLYHENKKKKITEEVNLRKAYFNLCQQLAA